MADDEAQFLWFQHPDTWVQHCTEFFHLANHIALPVMEAAVQANIGDRVACVIRTNAHPEQLQRDLRAAACKLHDLAHFLEDAANSGFCNAEFRPAVAGPGTTQ